MTPDEMESAAQIIYGMRWQTALARALGVTDRTVRRWYAGEAPIPGPVEVAIRALSDNARRRASAPAREP